MPRHCVAANCSTTSEEGYSLHEFPQDEALRAKWVQAVKRYRSNWNGPSSSSVLCSKHFKQDCLVVEGMRFRESMVFQQRCLTIMPLLRYSVDLAW